MLKKLAIKIVRAIFFGSISAYIFCPYCFNISSGENIYKVLLYYILTFLIIFEMFNFEAKLINKYFNWIDDYKKIFALHFLFIAFVFFPLNYIAVELNFGPYPERYSKYTIYFLKINNLFAAIIVLLYINSKYFFISWKKSYTKSQELDKHRINYELLALKNQINPHFLFNNLNTLSHLIAEKNYQAEEFTYELANIYRYLLKQKNSNVVSIKKEVEMLSSLIYIYKIKYNNSISFSIESTLFNEHKLATFTLQMLVENAVKHNVINEKDVLKIDIFIKNDFLVVKNNVLKKPVILYSSGIGLNNIIDRYKLLSDRDVIVNESEKVFVVKLPLL